MLIFWSLVRNSVVLAVYLLFSVACFLTVHEHFDRELLADGIVDVALAHSAHHTVNFQSGLCHKNYLQIGGLAPAK